MKNNKYLKIALVVILCLTMVLPLVLIQAGADAVNFDQANVGTGFKGKKISILGDSISTYEGVSNDSNANSTIGDNDIYYVKNNEYGVTREDTWWQQAIDKLELELCVNNSWSGSAVFGGDTDYTCASLTRAQQLHTASANPDIIAIYMGTNDIKNIDHELATFAANQSKMLNEADDTATSGINEFSLYVRMVQKAMSKYSGAQIYLFTLLPNETQTDLQIKAMEQYNQSIRELATYYQREGKDVYLVDLYNDTSITRDFQVIKQFMVNTLHPNDLGMDAITNCFLSSLVKNSGWAKKAEDWKTVEYDLTDVFVPGGQINTYRATTFPVPFAVSLQPSRPEYGLDVKVEAYTQQNTWLDVTSQVYSEGTIYIRSMPASQYQRMKITAKATYDPKNFRWELGANGLESCVANGADYSITGSLTQNPLTLENGSYADGTFTDAQYQLSDSILLRNEEPWVLEWKTKGALNMDQLVFSATDKSNSRSNMYVFWDNQKCLFLGYYNGYRSKYWNYGVKLSDITLGANVSHVFRLANKVGTDGSNQIYLYVDGVQKGIMQTYYVGSTAQGGTQSFLSGRDIEFSFLGAGTGYYLNDQSIEYIQVWEGGGFDTLRLQQLIAEYHNELSTTMASATGFDAYKTAVETAENYLAAVDQSQTQEKYDSYVTAIEKARRELTLSAGTTKIYSVELLNKDYVSIGKQTGLKVITTPDVEKLQVGGTARELLTNTSSIQTVNIDGVDTQVKVWLLTFVETGTTTAKDIKYTIYAFKDGDATSGSNANTTYTVSYGVN